MKKLTTYQLLNKETITLQKILKEIHNIKNFDKICKKSLQVIRNNKKIIFFGNGGSAADSQHLATELSIKYKKKRKAISGLALSADTSAITASGNDFGFKYIFSRQLEAIGKTGDIAIALTTSGNSQNLIEAFKLANKKKFLQLVFQVIREGS